MVTLTNAMLREQRLCLQDDPHFVSLDGRALKRLLREEMVIYSYQFKSATTIFNKEQCALSGKVGGMRDDIAIVLQLGVYWTSYCIDTSYE